MLRTVDDSGRTDAAGDAREFLDRSVVHLAPAEAVFEAMLTGFDRQQASRNLKRDTRRSRERLVRQLVAFSGSWPWHWTAADFDYWSATHRERGRTVAVVRGYQLAIAAFLRFAADPRYRWPTVCEQLFGAFPVEVVHDLNVVRHTTDYEGSAEHNRPLTAAEKTSFFTVANGRAGEATRLGRKGALVAHRDAAMFLAILGWGTRRTETSWLDACDFRRNPKAPGFGPFGQLVVRRGKSANGSPPRRRVVVTVFPWSATAMQHYLDEVRPRLFGRHDDVGALFRLSEDSGYRPDRSTNASHPSAMKQVSTPRSTRIVCAIPMRPLCSSSAGPSSSCANRWDTATLRRPASTPHCPTTSRTA